jgi:hypothetical protein
MVLSLAGRAAPGWSPGRVGRLKAKVYPAWDYLGVTRSKEVGEVQLRSSFAALKGGSQMVDTGGEDPLRRRKRTRVDASN